MSAPKYIAVLRTSAEAEVLEYRISIEGCEYYVPLLTTKRLIDAVAVAKKLSKESE